MKLLEWRSNNQPHCALVFGVGLIGSYLITELQAHSNTKSHNIDWSWSDPDLRARQSDSLISLVEEIAKCQNQLRAAVIWTAGAGAFSSPANSFDQEFAAFRDVCALATELSTNRRITECSLHLTSSAGGLFEGQCRVGLDTMPMPKRPYGETKLRQEAYLEGLDGYVRKFVYRPSSVYGFSRRARMGLVATLIQNAVRRETTRVFGSIATLRDFVFVEDIARFIASRIMYDFQPGVFTLASGKPTSLGEVLAIVRHLISNDLILQIDPNPSNSSDNTFLPGVLPSDFFATDLKTGIALTKQRLVREELMQ